MLFLQSCSEESYKLKSQQNSDAVQNFLNSVMVVGTYGRAGSGGGVSDLVEKLRNELLSLGIPEENIYVQSWNLDGDNGPGPDPTTGRHTKRIKDILDNHNQTTPNYLALFGHSFGGWASALLSQKVQEDIGYTADKVFLLDPVIFSTYRWDDEQNEVEAKAGTSWYQENAISTTEINHCFPIKSCDYLADISCGQQFDGIVNEESKYQRKADGSVLKKDCTLNGKQRKLQVHTTIDDDAYLQQTIFNEIVTDIKTQIAVIRNID